MGPVRRLFHILIQIRDLHVQQQQKKKKKGTRAGRITGQKPKKKAL